MGSGKLIQRAIAKYGLENFTKEILFIFDNEKDMNAKEKELVELSEQSYNLCPGGKGGFGYINNNKLNMHPNCTAARKTWMAKNHKKLTETRVKSEKFRQSLIKKSEIIKEKYPEGVWKGKKHKQESIEKMKASHKGQSTGTKNSQFGTFWVTNGTENKKAKDFIPAGWYKGRVIT